ncbi:MAG: hypothetical protein AAFQ42_02725, partial [Pseudomonadota bacterium]
MIRAFGTSIPARPLALAALLLASIGLALLPHAALAGTAAGLAGLGMLFALIVAGGPAAAWLSDRSVVHGAQSASH